MTACTSFVSTRRSTPRTISVPSSSATCRLLISSSDKACDSPSFDGAGRAEAARDDGKSSGSRPPDSPPHGAILGPMGPVGWQEMIIILVVLLLLFGAKRLPEMGRSLGRGMREFKDAVTGNDDRHEPDELAPPAATTAPTEHTPQ